MNKFVLALSLVSLQASALPIDEAPTTFLPFPEPEIFTAVKVNIGSIGGEIDSTLIELTRKLTGHAVSTGAVDRLIVTSANISNPFPLAPTKSHDFIPIEAIPVEGGFSFCAESGVNFFEFNKLISELKSLQPSQGTFYDVNVVDKCFGEEG